MNLIYFIRSSSEVYMFDLSRIPYDVCYHKQLTFALAKYDGLLEEWIKDGVCKIL